MSNKNKVSIYLIKENLTDKEIIKEHFKFSETDQEYKIINLDPHKRIYYCLSYDKTPSWVKTFFLDNPKIEKIHSAYSKLVLLVDIEYKDSIRTFAITMGYGKFLLAEDVYEPNFGLKILLNIIDKDQLRKINKTDVSGKQKSSSEQLPMIGSIDDFDINVEKELINSITGTSNNDSLFKGTMTGRDYFNVTAEVDINSIDDYLKKCIEKYESSVYKEHFSWIDNILYIKEKSIQDVLDNEMFKKIMDGAKEFWMAVPEVIDWDRISGFEIPNISERQQDIDKEIILKSYKKGLTSVEQFKNKYIKAIDSVNDHILHTWSVYKCIYGEMDYNGKSYCINNGKWYVIDRDFKKEVEEDYERTSISTIGFDIFDKSIHKDEGDYTIKFCDKNKEEYMSLDKGVIFHGGGQSKIELCDILSKKHEFIHLKPYKSSATLSHLFNQGKVSMELILNDSSFVNKANEKIKKKRHDFHDFLIDVKDRDSFKVVYGIIQEGESEGLPRLPFFSKVVLKSTKKSLNAMKCPVEIIKIYKNDNSENS